MKRVRNLLGTGFTFGLVVALQSGCARTATVTQPIANQEALQQQAVGSEVRNLSGTVVETMNAGTYTYVNLEKNGRRSWVAFPYTQVSVGQEVEVLPGTSMGKFTSKSLNRTFDDIVFSAGLVTDSKGALPTTSSPASDVKSTLPPGHPAMDAPPQVGHGAPPLNSNARPNGHAGMMEQPGKAMAVVSGKVIETMDAGGYTYIHLDGDGKKVWVAVPSMKVAVGQELKLQPGHEMSNFTSRSLDRTFDTVIFSAGPVPATK